MAKHIEKKVVEIEHTIVLTQSELNTIFLLLGRSTDSEVKNLAEENHMKDFAIKDKLTELYRVFKEQATYER